MLPKNKFGPSLFPVSYCFSKQQEIQMDPFGMVESRRDPRFDQTLASRFKNMSVGLTHFMKRRRRTCISRWELCFTGRTFNVFFETITYTRGQPHSSLPEIRIFKNRYLAKNTTCWRASVVWHDSKLAAVKHYEFSFKLSLKQTTNKQKNITLHLCVCQVCLGRS